MPIRPARNPPAASLRGRRSAPVPDRSRRVLRPPTRHGAAARSAGWSCPRHSDRRTLRCVASQASPSWVRARKPSSRYNNTRLAAALEDLDGTSVVETTDCAGRGAVVTASGEASACVAVDAVVRGRFSVFHHSADLPKRLAVLRSLRPDRSRS